MRTDPATDFVLLVDKPVGPTSHDVVASARRALRTRRVGHTGTLDPFASGLLLLCVNRATRIAEFLSALPKTYSATARLDAFTTTDDSTGSVTNESSSWRLLDEASIKAAMNALTGEIEQVPPQYSAKRVSGERVYRRARRGEVVELAPVRVQVRRFELTRLQLPEIDFVVDCSSGTYVRALARDLGRNLGTGGFLSALRRTKIGSFDVRDALPALRLDDPQLRAAAAVTPLRALGHLPRVDVAEELAARLRLGQSIPGSNDGREVVVVSSGDELIALARQDGNLLKPFKVWSLPHD
jgi:tRNA pseudouridine55 synthase